MRYRSQLTGRAGRLAAHRLAPLLVLVLIIGEMLPGAGPLRVASAADSIFAAPHAFGPTFGDMRSMAMGDMNGDGALDLVAVNNYGQNVVYLNDGAGSFAGGDAKCALTSTSLARCFGTSNSATTSVAVGDINSDGALDIIAGTSYGQSAVYLNDGLGNFPNGDGSVDICKVPRVSCFGDSFVTTQAVAVGDMNGDGALDLIATAEFGVCDPFGGCYVALNDVVYLNSTTGVFYRGPVDCANPPSDVRCFNPAGIPTSLALGDLNDDGALDLVTGNSGGAGMLLLNLNDGTGQFAAPIPTGVMSNTTDVALGDLNGDGALDLVASNAGYYDNFTNQFVAQPSVVLLNRNDGTGQFGVPISTSVVSNTTDVAVGDLNGDGALDLVFGMNDGQPAVVLFNKNDKAAGFDQPVRVPGIGTAFTSVAIGDLNGDRIVDLALGNYLPKAPNGIDPPGQIGQVYVNAGKTAFGISVAQLAQSGGASSTAVADLNNDGWLDIVLGGYDQANRVYLNNGSGGFGGPTLLSDIGGTRGVAVADLNADGWPDIVLANNSQSSQVYFNDGAGGFGVPNFLSDNGGATSVAVGDLNFDGWPDLVIGNDRQASQIFLNQGSGDFASATPISLPDSVGASGVAITDLNFDGMPEILLSSSVQGGQVYLAPSFGDVAGFQPVALPSNGTASSVAVGDLNGDGWTDILLGGLSQPSRVYLNLGYGDITGLQPIDLQGSADTYGVAIADLNGDQALDIVLANFAMPSQVYLNKNDHTGGFSAPLALPQTGQGARGVAVGDFNHDNWMDAVLSNLNGPSQVLLGNRAPPPDRLPNNAPTIALTQPCPQPPDTNVVEIPYTLADREADSIGTVRAVYSLDGGGTWHTAVPTNTVTTNLPTSRAGTAYIYRWDTLASGIFASSDNVVFRVEAYSVPLAGTAGSPGTYLYPQSTPGPYQLAGASATTCVFHVQGNPVRVVSDDQPEGVPGALVYRLPNGAIRGAKPVADTNGNPIQTGPDGYLWGQGDLVAGDRLFAMAAISNTLIGDRSLNFDGVDDFVPLGQPAALNIIGTITIEAWVNTPNPYQLANIVARGYSIAPTLGEDFLRINWGRYQIGSWNGDDHLASYTIPPEDYGAWVHLAGVYDGTTWRLYRNGVEVSAALDSTGAVPVSGNWAIGARGTGTERFFQGAMHDVRIWRVARTPAEIQADMSGNLQGDEPGLAAAWPMDEGKGTIVHDRATNHSNGTISNGPSWSAGPPSPPAPAQTGSLVFNGTADYLQLPSVAGLQPPPGVDEFGFPLPPTGNFPHTIEAWVRPDRLPANRSWPLLLGYPQSGAHHWLINRDGTTQIGVWAGAQLHPILTPGGWHHIASVFDGTFLRVYIDGSLSTSIVDGTPTTSISATFDLQGIPLVLAQPPVNSIDEENFFAGAISDVQVWKTPRSATQVLRDMQSPPSQPDPDLMLYWPLNDGANNTVAHDQSDSHVNDGYFSHGPSWGSKVKYTIYQTSGDPNQSGLDMRSLTQPGVQTLTLSRSRPLILFNLDVSLEWDASNDQQFKNQLEFDLQRTSELLYDWSNGQAALGNVAVYFNKERWDTADIQIFATNRLRPNASQGGIVTQDVTEVIPRSDGSVSTVTYEPGHVRMGAAWNRNGDATGTIGEDWPRAMAHELSHYLFFLDDNYIGMEAQPDGTKRLISVDTCPGAMSDPYRDDYSEYHPQTGWNLATTCAQTLSNYNTGRSDWETIAKFYPSLHEPPAGAGFANLLKGPSGLPLAVTQITFASKQQSAPLNSPLFYLLDEQGGRYLPRANAQAYLFPKGGDRVIDLGEPTLDQILARGAQVGDTLCVYDLSADHVGCTLVNQDDHQLRLGVARGWQPDVIATPVTSRTLAITVTNVTLPPATTLGAQLFPHESRASGQITLASTPQGYLGRIDLTEPVFEGALHVWVNEQPRETRREIITAYALGGNPAPPFRPRRRSRRKAPVLSADGQVILFAEDLDQKFEAGQFYSIQSTTVITSPPPWSTPVGQGYRLLASARAPDLASSRASLSIGYLENEVPTGAEGGIALYFRDSTGWKKLPGQELDTDRNEVSAQVGGPGLYALMTSVDIHAGWNLLSYPWTSTRPVSESLRLIGGEDAAHKPLYTTVYGYVISGTSTLWQIYDTTVPQDWAPLVNNLETLQYGRGYWIYVPERAPIAAGVAAVSANAPAPTAVSVPAPPATYYGVAPSGAQTLEAKVDGKVCGTADTTPGRIHGQLRDVLIIQVHAAQFGTDAGCGAPGDPLTFRFLNGQGQEVAVWNTRWDNSQAHELLQNNPFPDQLNRIYLPIVAHGPRSNLNSDLVVVGIEVRPAAPRAGEATEVVVTIRNNGPTKIDQAFWVDLYVDPSAIPAVNRIWPDVSAFGASWRVYGLAADGQIKLSTLAPNDPQNPGQNYSNFRTFGPGAHKLYVLADSYAPGAPTGAVAEHDEQNNLHGPVEVNVRQAAATVQSAPMWVDTRPGR